VKKKSCEVIWECKARYTVLSREAAARLWPFFKGQMLELHAKENVKHDTLFYQRYSCKDPPLVSSKDKQCNVQLQILCEVITGLHFLCLQGSLPFGPLFL